MSNRLDTRPNASLQRVGTSTRATVDRIVKVYQRATPQDRIDGAAWYGNGESLIRDLSTQTGLSAEHVAAVVSHLSPRTDWGRNVYGATMLVTTGTAPKCLKANVARARRALASDAPLDTFGPTAPKTHRFARNLLGDRESVTVDVWAARVAFGSAVADPEAALSRVGVYGAVEHAYRLAARRLGVDPTTVQATTWVVIRGSAV
jgi:hypothetical protein